MDTAATGKGMRKMVRLRKRYGKGRCKNRKGIARVRLPHRTIQLAEVHWFEARGIGKNEDQIKLPILE